MEEFVSEHKKNIEIQFEELQKSYDNDTKLYVKYYSNHTYNDIENSHDIASKIKDKNVDSAELYYSLIPQERIYKEMKTYEFLFYNPQTSFDNIDDIVTKSEDVLKIYQNVVGGYNIEDSDWIKLTESNKRFKIQDNQILLLNTITIRDAYDKDLLWFMTNLVTCLSKYTDETKIKIKQKILRDDNNDICWILLVFEKQ